MAQPVKPAVVQDPKRTVSPRWCGAEPGVERGGEQAVVRSSSVLATAFWQGTLGSPRMLNLNPALEGDCGSRWRGHLWAEFACLGVCWGQRRCAACGPHSYPLLRPRGKKDLPVLTRVPSAVRNKDFFIFLCDLPPSYIPSLHLTILFVFFKIYMQLLVKVCPAKPTVLSCLLVLATHLGHLHQPRSFLCEFSSSP